MGAWWNSLEKVSNFNTYVLGFAALFGFVTAILIIVGWVLGNRVSDLQQSQLAQFRAEADIKIAGANKIAAQASEHAAQLENQTAELRNQNLKIQEKMAWRFIAPAKQAQIIEHLKTYKGHTVQISVVEDAEAAAYADNFLAIFSQAGWVIQRNTYSVYYSAATKTYGVVCRIESDPDSGVAAVTQSFKEAGISLQTDKITGEGSFIEIFVGPKPEI
jgi:hypothetical protein